MTCTLCDALLIPTKDKNFYECNQCGALQRLPKDFLNKEQEKAHYDWHSNDVNDLRYQNFTAPITETILHHFQPSHLGLDYGCGNGPVITKMLQDKNFTVMLYDPYYHPNLDYLNHKYDYIFSCEVFEHFYNPKIELEKLLNLLKPNGLLLIMTLLYLNQMPFEKWYYRLDPTHVFIYTHKTMTYIAKTYQLSIKKASDRLYIFEKQT